MIEVEENPPSRNQPSAMNTKQSTHFFFEDTIEDDDEEEDQDNIQSIFIADSFTEQ